ncbi:hypothetical protein HDE76_003781 [Rhodanobacter sp. ANJX3]|uniref:helix-turn-helix transcriptional regulator n=1 Tax=Rhodanobacter sp. ANJX3 TaxID=2723083 RepID=UPI001622302B|nr:helix-turn-helix transcriptional regulator [Rhodanobacter sp. ANJX3]MBB5360537.1 hypothetical protein [Rhodanobacter sp. ANJX3]
MTKYFKMISGIPVPIPYVLRVARLGNQLSMQQAADLAASSRRSWEGWESGDRPIPPAKLLLFLHSLQVHNNSGLVAIFRITNGQALPIDMLTPGTFVGLTKLTATTSEVRSLALDHITGEMKIFVTEFVDADNQHAMSVLQTWRSVIDRAAEAVARNPSA